jgi:serine/threonine-protein kinase
MNTPPTSDPTASTLVGKYRLIALLGEGGAANAYLAVAQGPAGFNKLVVLKVLRRTYAEDPELLELFLDEARIAARLNHPNVVQTYEVGNEAGTCFMAMEYVDGQAYSKVLQRGWQRDRLPLAMHLRVLIESLAGLDYAHTLEDFNGRRLDLVHRDVSPHNIVVTYGGHAKILDFGIAKVVGSTVRTDTGVFRGKPAYAAPEQATSAPFDRRADIYAVGLILWEVLAGRRLRTGGVAQQMLTARSSDEAPSPRTVDPDVPQDLERVCLRALRRDPGARYSSAQEMQLDLEAAMHRLGKPVSAAALGQRVADMFEKDRADLRRLIDAQLALATATPIRLVDDFSPVAIRRRTPEPVPQTAAGDKGARARRKGRLGLAGAIACGASIAAFAAAGIRRPHDSATIVTATRGEPAPSAVPSTRVEPSAAPPPAPGESPARTGTDVDASVNVTLVPVAGRSRATRPPASQPGTPAPAAPTDHALDPRDPYPK